MRNVLAGSGLFAFFLGWNAPNHYPPWPAFHLEFLAAVGLCLIGAAACLDPGHTRSPLSPAVPRLRMSWASRLWLLVAAIPLLQLLTGTLVFRGDALLGMLYAMGVGLGIYIGQLWVARQGRRQVMTTLWLTLLFSGLAADGLALVQWLRLPNPGWWAMELIDDRPYANFAQPNHFGLAMVFSIVAATALFEMSLIRSRWVYAQCVVFLGWGILMSQSRASALALVAVAVLWLATRSRLPTRLRLSDLAIAAAAALLLGLAILPLEHLLGLAATEVRATPDLGPRQWIWLHFWAAIAEHPWWGYGFNQGVRALAEVAPAVHPSRNVTFAHNVVLDLMTWAGIPLALLMSLGLVLWMLGWLRKGPDVKLATQRHWVFAIWLALLIQSLLEFPYAHTYFLLPAVLLAGAVTGSGLGVPAPTRVRADPMAAVLALVAVALLGVTGWEYFRMEDDFRYNRFAHANFIGRPDHEALETPWLLDQLGALNASAKLPARAGMSADELARMRMLARRFHIISTRLDYARALALNGRLAEAEAELVIVRSVCPPQQWAKVHRQWDSWLASHPAGAPRPQAPGDP